MPNFNIFSGIQGSRDLVSGTELRDGLRGGWLVPDTRRRRPRYFDGRFLTARDLTEDQAYFLSRMADLGQVTEGGVVEGLMIDIADQGRRVEITKGHGFTPNGELVFLDRDIEIDLDRIQAARDLDVHFGIRREPRAPARNRSGVWVVALRPVEYEANPVASYPKELGGQRNVELGDIVEATAVTIIPYGGEIVGGGAGTTRARLAYETFIGGHRPRLPTDALPLGIVSFTRGRVEWHDVYIGRRDVVRDSTLGFGLGHRATREAFLRQYMDHALDVETEFGQSFAVTDHFFAIPPSGRIPRGAISRGQDGLVQSFFPPEMDVTLTVVPEDEIPALLEESLMMAPIDLTLDAEVFEAMSISILLPVKRNELPQKAFELERLDMPVRGVVPGFVARAKPIHALDALRMRRLEKVREAQPVVVDPWDALVRGAKALYYVRRRNLPPIADVVPREREPAPVIVVEEPLEGVARDRVEAAGEKTRYYKVLSRAKSDVHRLLANLLETPPFAEATWVSALIYELERVFSPRVNEGVRYFSMGSKPGLVAKVKILTATLLRTVSVRYPPTIGAGIARMLAAEPELGTPAARQVVAASYHVPELDERLAKQSAAEAKKTSAKIRAFAAQGNAQAIASIAAGGVVVVEAPATGTGAETGGTTTGGTTTGSTTASPIEVASVNAKRADELELFEYLLDNVQDNAKDNVARLLAESAFKIPALTTGAIVEMVAATIEIDKLEDARAVVEGKAPNKAKDLTHQKVTAVAKRYASTSVRPLGSGLKMLASTGAARLIEGRALRMIALAGVLVEFDTLVVSMRPTSTFDRPTERPSLPSRPGEFPAETIAKKLLELVQEEPRASVLKEIRALVEGR